MPTGNAEALSSELYWALHGKSPFRYTFVFGDEYQYRSPELAFRASLRPFVCVPVSNAADSQWRKLANTIVKHFHGCTDDITCKPIKFPWKSITNDDVHCLLSLVEDIADKCERKPIGGSKAFVKTFFYSASSELLLIDCGSRMCICSDPEIMKHRCGRIDRPRNPEENAVYTNLCPNFTFDLVEGYRRWIHGKEVSVPSELTDAFSKWKVSGRVGPVFE